MQRFYIKHSGNTFRYKRLDKATHRPLYVCKSMPCRQDLMLIPSNNTAVIGLTLITLSEQICCTRVDVEKVVNAVFWSLVSTLI